MMEAEELQALADDIRRNGLRQPIVKWQGKVLDGRNRQAACLLAGRALRFETYRGSDPLGFVLSQNLERRHLTESQRAMLGADLQPQFEAEANARMKSGKRDPEESLPQGKRKPQSREHAAKRFRVSGRLVQDAKRVLSEAPELGPRVRDGSIRLAEARALLTWTDSNGLKVAFTVRERLQILAKKDKNPKHINIALEAQAVANKHKLKGAASLGTVKGKYQLFYIDPPWKEDCPSVSRPVPYPQMTQAELLALAPQVQRLAADESIMFMWTTSPRLPEALEIMRAYGFEYRTSAIWCKQGKAGLGHWLRNQHEQLLVGLRGKFPCPPPGCKPNSVVHAKLRGHSKKPDEIYALIESMYPGVNLRKLEMFARNRHDSSWTVWGAEAPIPKARQGIAQTSIAA
jgi:N6-adenosine-specific RNA methylase IME4